MNGKEFSEKKRKPLVGDGIEIDLLSEEEKEGNLIKIYPRSNELIRPGAGQNIDQAFVIFAASDPKPNFSLLIVLLSMEVHDIPVYYI